MPFTNTFITLHIFNISWIIGTRHNWSSGILKYDIVVLTNWGVRLFTSALQQRPMLYRLLPYTVVRSSLFKLAKVRITDFTDFKLFSWNLIKRDDNITFGCRHSDIVSIRYLCVVLSSLNICRTVTFHARNRRSHTSEKRL